MQYDANNRLISMTDAAGTTAFGYTDFGALLSEDGPWSNDTVTYGFTTNRLRNKLTLLQPSADAWAQSYGYDSADRLTGIYSRAGQFGYAYGPGTNTLVSTLWLPNACYIGTTFDTSGRLLGTYLRRATDQTTINSHEYQYDAANRRTRQTRTDGSNADYTYDSIGQLKTATGKEPGGTTNRMHEQQGYTYDAAGNLNYRTNGALVQSFGVDSLNQLTTLGRSGAYTVAGTTWGLATNVTVSDNGNAAVAASRYADATFARANVTLVDGTNTFTALAQDSYGRTDSNTVTAYLPASGSFVYDGNGNLLTDGRRHFSYDDENQLITVVVTNSTRSDFTYDGKMRRRVRQEYQWTAGSWNLIAEIRYVYDGKLVIQERNAMNLPQVTYTRGRDLSGSLEGAGGIGGLLARTDNSLLAIGDANAHAYYHADGNGNVTMLVDASQRVVARYLYDPYGNTVAATGPMADANLYRFSSKELHPASGMVYYLYRFYAPEVQRWANRDPIGESGSSNIRKRLKLTTSKEPNLYEFAKNSPIFEMDPEGLTCFSDCMAAEHAANKASLETCLGWMGIAFAAEAFVCMVGCIPATVAGGVGYPVCLTGCLTVAGETAAIGAGCCFGAYVLKMTGATAGFALGCAN
jgi:RHS repeat-associated protein